MYSAIVRFFTSVKFGYVLRAFEFSSAAYSVITNVYQTNKGSGIKDAPNGSSTETLHSELQTAILMQGALSAFNDSYNTKGADAATLQTFLPDFIDRRIEQIGDWISSPGVQEQIGEYYREVVARDSSSTTNASIGVGILSKTSRSDSRRFSTVYDPTDMPALELYYNNRASFLRRALSV